MTKYKELFTNKGEIVFLTLNKNNVIAVGNIENILDEIQKEVDAYMKENNINMVNIITSNNLDLINYEKE